MSDDEPLMSAASPDGSAMCHANSGAAPSGSIAEAIRVRAAELGFDLVGFASAEPFARERELVLASLDAGRLVGMTWITADRIRLSCDPESLLPGCRSIIALGTAYAAEPPPIEIGGPDTADAESAPRLRGRVARYAWGRDYHNVIPPRLKALAETIVALASDDYPRGAPADSSRPDGGLSTDAAGVQPAAGLAPAGKDRRSSSNGQVSTGEGPERARARYRTFVDTGPLVDRAVAERAELGFIGKNTCILTGPHGSFVFLSAILTTADVFASGVESSGGDTHGAGPSSAAVATAQSAGAFSPISAAVRAQPRDCGTCRACLDACPTQAFVGPRQLDATRCVAYLTIEHRGSIPRELRPKIGTWVFGCDACQDVCPWNRARKPATLEDLMPHRGAGSTLDLAALLALDEAAFRERFRGTPLTRAKRAGLLRNAAIVLGNLGDPSAESALVEALADAEPLVRGHAAWALSRLPGVSRHAELALEQAAAIEADPDVHAEMVAALQTRHAEPET